MTHLNLPSKLTKLPAQTIQLEVNVRDELHAIALLSQPSILGPAHQFQLLVEGVQLTVPG